jgi:hypothetical protein
MARKSTHTRRVVTAPTTQQTTPPRHSAGKTRAERLTLNASDNQARTEQQLRELARQVIESMPGTFDAPLARYLERYGAWVLKTEGMFNPAIHLDEVRIQAWIAQELGHLAESSQGTAYLALRRAGNEMKAARRKMYRNIAAPPHSDAEWERYEATIQSLTGTQLGADLRMTLDLTGGVGLAKDEVGWATGEWVMIENDRVSIYVPKDNGEYRVMPAFGEVAARLVARAGSPEYLVAPQRPLRRANVVSDLVYEAHKKIPAGMRGFKTTRARYRWAIQLYRMPLPFEHVAALVGLHPGSHTASDLLMYLPPTDPNVSAAMLVRLVEGTDK